MAALAMPIDSKIMPNNCEVPNRRCPRARHRFEQTGLLRFGETEGDDWDELPDTRKTAADSHCTSVILAVNCRVVLIPPGGDTRTTYFSFRCPVGWRRRDL